MWRDAMGRVVGAMLFVVLFNAVALSVFVRVPPAYGLAWTVALIVSFIWWHFRQGGHRSARTALVRLDLPRGGVWPWIAIGASLLIASGTVALIRFAAPELEPENVSPFHQALLMYEDSAVGWAALVAAVAVLAPLVEEFVFRGYVQHTLERLVGPALGIGLASGVFALAHWGASHWSFLMLPLALGAACGCAAYFFNSIWVAVAIHGSWNLGMTVWARAAGGRLVHLAEPSAWWPLIGFGLISLGFATWVLVWNREAGPEALGSR